MGKKSKRSGNKFFVYSTNPDQEFVGDEEDYETPEPSEQRLRLEMQKKGRAGKTVTVVKGFEGTDDDFKDLAKELKTYCGSGGSVKDGEIIIQGDVRKKAIQKLKELGYSDTK